MQHKNRLVTSTSVRGNTVRRLFSREKMAELLANHGVELTQKQKSSFAAMYEAGLNHGLTEGVVRAIVNNSERPMFQVNALWRFFKKNFSVDLVIPYVTGTWKYGGVISNTITDVGKKICADQLGGTTTSPVTAVAIGTGSPTATALGSEITTGGGSRGAATVSNQTTTTTGDTERWTRTFNFTGSFSITEEGLFDNNTSGGNMLASQSFSAVNVGSGDSLQITHDVVFS